MQPSIRILQSAIEKPSAPCPMPYAPCALPYYAPCASPAIIVSALTTLAARFEPPLRPIFEIYGQSNSIRAALEGILHNRSQPASALQSLIRSEKELQEVLIYALTSDYLLFRKTSGVDLKH